MSRMELKSRTYPVELLRIVDGDTVFLKVDLGFRVYGSFEFRLYGINCPEMNTPEGQAAKEFVVRWFIEMSGHEFFVDSYKNPEKYGRWLGVIYPKEGESLNLALLRTGNAKSYP